MDLSDRFKQVPMQLTLLFIGFLLTFAAQAWAFTDPSSAPPAGDLPAPLNTGSASQTKIGPLIVNSGAAAVGFSVPAGKVGVGTLLPNNALDIRSSLASVYANFYTGGSTAAVGNTGSGLALESTNKVSIFTGGSGFNNDGSAPLGTERVTVGSNGRVGIGTNNPESLLTLDQSAFGGGWDAGITLKNNTGTHSGQLVESTDGGLQFGIDSTEIGRITSEGMRLSSGKVYCVTDCAVGNAGITSNITASVTGPSGSCTALQLSIRGGIVTAATGSACP